MELSCIKSKLKKSKEVIFDNKKIALTVVWVLFVLCQAIDQWSCLSLNEKGDFLAGFFSPLAFLWLVLGYYQQGEELRLNTEALKLQIEELNQSVEQQRIMAKLAQEKSDSDRLRVQPIFDFKCTKSPLASGENRYLLEIKNKGFLARDIVIKVSEDVFVAPDIVQLGLMDYGDVCNFGFTFDSSDYIKDGFCFYIFYVDGVLRPNQEKYLIINGKVNKIE